jgi:hypothetical protein
MDNWKRIDLPRLQSLMQGRGKLVSFENVFDYGNVRVSESVLEGPGGVALIRYRYLLVPDGREIEDGEEYYEFSSLNNHNHA